MLCKILQVNVLVLVILRTSVLFVVCIIRPHTNKRLCTSVTNGAYIKFPSVLDYTELLRRTYYSLPQTIPND